MIQLLLVALLPVFASAQPAAAPSVQRFRPALGNSGFVAIDDARLGAPLSIRADLTFDYAWRPVQITGAGGRREGVIDGLVGAHARLAFVAAEWAEIDVTVPFLQLAIAGSALDEFDEGAAVPSLGDVEIAGRLVPLREDQGVGVAVIPFVTLPTGRPRALLTHGVPTFGVRAAVSRRWRPMHVAANVGYRLKPGFAVLGDAALADDEILFGAGVGVSPLPERLDIDLEWFGSTSVGPGAKTLTPVDGFALLQTPMEAGLTARVRLPAGFEVAAGATAGLTPAPGTPPFRILLSVAWASGADSDGDGDRIVGRADACPDEAEDWDGFMDRDGCPDLDNDNDGLVDGEDRCPDEPEDYDSWQDGDGCPEPDNDGDRQPDERDGCPDEAEDLDGFEDTDGCPDLDNDGDEIPDTADACPDFPEVINAFEDDDGCPDESNVRLIGDRIEILNAIQFVPGSTDEVLRESFAVLEDVLAVLRVRQEIAVVRVSGHTDDVGDAASNLALSEGRAMTVMRYLIHHGIDPDRLEAAGFGESRPIAPNDTDAGRTLNRRVEFDIVERK